MKIRLFNKDSWTQSSRIWIGINFDGQKKIYTIKFKDLSIFKPLSYQLLWEILWFEAMKYLTEPFTYEANGSKYFSPKTTADPHFCQVSFCLIPLLSEKGVTIRIAPVLQSTIVMIYHFWDPCWWCELMYLMKIGQHSRKDWISPSGPVEHIKIWLVANPLTVNAPL